MDRICENKIPEINKKAACFLQKYSMYYGDVDLQKHIDHFLEEMRRGLSGKQSSLKCYPTYIDFKKTLPKNKPVIVLDAGGTNLRSAIVHFDEKNTPVISKLKQCSMPGIKKELDLEEFFHSIAMSIDHVLDDSTDIGFVFSYAIEMYPDKDGKLDHWTKEIKAKEVVGQFIGKNLISAINKIKNTKISKRTVLLNDTVASLLSGISAFQGRTFESYAGFILGTGMNAAYIEKNSNIKKVMEEGFGADGYQIINLEAGNYYPGPLGKIDISFDKKTLKPDSATYEKMISGAYLGGLAFETLKYAINDGLFSKEFSSACSSIKGLDSRDIDDYLAFPPKNEPFSTLTSIMSTSDRIILYILFDSLIERAAMLAAIVLSSVILKSGRGLDPCKPFCIVAEGSSFYKMKNFYCRVDSYIKDSLLNRGNYYFEIHKVENAILLGAAAAALI